MAERAVEECTIAIERNPGFTSNWTQRARAYGDLGRHAEEEADISRAIELAVRPVDLDGALSSRAFLRLARGDSAGAMEDANRRQAIASSDEHRDVLGISIEFYTRSDRYQLALYTGIFDNVINDLTWLLDHPEQVDKYDRFQNYPTGRGANVLLADRGYAHLLTGERELGLADIDASLAANPDQARARIYRAYAHIVAGEFELATADLDDADRLFDAQTYHFGGELGAQIHLYRATILFEQHEDVLARHQLDQGLEEVGTHFIRRALEALRDEMAAEAP
jgi:tetratricopeptide (TPR) repeat protein